MSTTAQLNIFKFLIHFDDFNDWNFREFSSSIHRFQFLTTEHSRKFIQPDRLTVTLTDSLIFVLRDNDGMKMQISWWILKNERLGIFKRIIQFFFREFWKLINIFDSFLDFTGTHFNVGFIRSLDHIIQQSSSIHRVLISFTFIMKYWRCVYTLSS